jgi:DNA-binding NarL/FixJ family response regulator
LLALGYQDRQIAKPTGISESSVHRHATAILKRLDASTRFEADVTARRWKWIS